MKVEATTTTAASGMAGGPGPAAGPKGSRGRRGAPGPDPAPAGAAGAGGGPYRPGGGRKAKENDAGTRAGTGKGLKATAGGKGKVLYPLFRKVACHRCGVKMWRGREQVDIFRGRVLPICPECLAEVLSERTENDRRWSELVAEIENKYLKKTGGPGKKGTSGAAGRGRAKKKGEEQDVHSGKSGGEEA